MFGMPSRSNKFFFALVISSGFFFLFGCLTIIGTKNYRDIIRTSEIKSPVSVTPGGVGPASNAQNDPKLGCTHADIKRRSSTVVLTTSNAAFLDVAENMLESIKRTRACPNITVIAEDERSYQHLTERMKSQPGLHVQKTEGSLAPSKSLEVGSRPYIQLVNRRPSYVLSFLEKGYNVLFLDSDTFWFQDPFSDFQGDFDIALHNERVNQMLFCAGFAYYRSTANTRNLVSQWVQMLKSTPPPIADQGFLNKLIRIQIKSGLKVKTLNSSRYPDGNMYFRRKGWREENNDTVVLHLSYIKGHDGKVNILKEFGLWLL